jgi:hypothetical protein
MENENDNANANANTAAALNTQAPPYEPVQASANMRLPEFWPENPRGWFAMAEAQFMLRRVTSGIDTCSQCCRAPPTA